MNNQLIDGLVQTILSLSLEERQLLLRRIQDAQTRDEIHEKLHHYEQQYGMTSEQFYQQFLTDELGDAADYIDWAGFYEQMKIGIETDKPDLEETSNSLKPSRLSVISVGQCLENTYFRREEF